MGKLQQQQQQLTTTLTKINSPQQSPAITTTLQQQQYLSTTNACSTMPAMPKEKATAAVSMSESNFNEVKRKESAAMAATTAQQAASGRLQSTTVAAAASTCGNGGSTSPQQQQRNTCGCGAASATEIVGSSLNRNNKYLTTNGHSSPLAAAVAAQSVATATSAQRTAAANNTCCRKFQNGNMPRPPATPAETAAAATAATATTSAQLAASNATAASPLLPVTPPKRTSNDYIFGRWIGEGSFSTVYLAYDVTTKREYAIKVCEKRHILRENKQEYIRREREVMHMLTNVPGFVNLTCTFQDNRKLFFVMTLAKNGDLLPCINRVGSFDVDCTRHYAAELVLACEQMHRRNIVHRDLKPENILLDEDMHTLIADFGSAKVLTPEEVQRLHDGYERNSGGGGSGSSNYASAEESNDDDDEDDVNDNDYVDSESNGGGCDTGSDDVDSPAVSRHSSSAPQHSRYQGQRRRKGSFVGTAQYVSPEVLRNGVITPAADLWALGCIVYQMISGLPPFRGANEYIIFKKILACDVEFPAGFDKDAADLVRQLLRANPAERLGAQDAGVCYESIRTHPFFADVDFATLRQQTPPPIYPYLPGESQDADFVDFCMPDNLEPGLDDKQLNRLLGMELGSVFSCELQSVIHNNDGESVDIEQKTATKNIFDLSYAERQRRLEQQKSDKWHVFADNEVILRKGLVNKRKGLFARKRMLLLTTGPRLIYIDPVTMIKKGEIPWSADLRVEVRNFKMFFVHTPNRTYYLDDPDGYSLQWGAALDDMHALIYPEAAALRAATYAKTASN